MLPVPQSIDKNQKMADRLEEEFNVPTVETFMVLYALEGIADPGTSDIQLETQGSQDGGEERIVLHAVAAELPLNDLVKERLWLEGQGAMPGIVQSDIAPRVESQLAELECPQSSEGVSLDLGFQGFEGVGSIWCNTFRYVLCELVAGVGWAG